MWAAMAQGLAPALEQRGRYYWKGILIAEGSDAGEALMQEAASLLSRLGNPMPANAIAHAKAMR